MELLVKLKQNFRVQKVYEPVPNIAVVLKFSRLYFDVTGQVKKVVGVGKVTVNLLGQVLDCVLVGDVPDHEGSPGVVADISWVDFEHVGVVVSYLFDRSILLWPHHRLAHVLSVRKHRAIAGIE